MPPPKFGNAFFDCLDVAVLATVPLCWLRCVSIRLSAVGCLSRSRAVLTCASPISSLTTDAAEEPDDEEPVEAVCVLLRPPSSLFP